MSRVIKYQAWDKVNKVMRDVWSITWDFTPDNPTAIIACNPIINSEYILREGQFELRQYTGLKDKNGKEIYEGDIVKENNGRTTGKIVFMNGSFCSINEFDRRMIPALFYGDAIDGMNANFYEVIGNIYENPELI